MSLPENFILDQFLLGPWANYMYFIGDAKSREVAVVDPAWDAQAIIERARAHDYTIVAVLLTHGHSDHVNALDGLLRTCDVPVYISRFEHPAYMPQHKNVITVSPDQEIAISGIKVKALHTPGHTPGCQCYLYQNVLLTGDTLFIDGCGRCDLQGGDAEKMYDSLNNVIKKLPPETIIYTGHQYGPAPYATLASQMQTNPYLKCDTKEEFLRERM
jgi:glyoxylase-like metal-dependent hydrolase (beta-lactamase superfamily II)